MNNRIIIRRIAGGFSAECNGRVAAGQTWVEAVGALVVTNASMFEVAGISFDKRDSATFIYMQERGMTSEIV